MPKKFLVALIALFAIAVFSYAQLPPEVGPDGVPYLKVNINPGPTPPQVNINPYGIVPLVEVTKAPDVRFAPIGCEDRRNFRTAIGASIAGPLVVTYMNTSDQTSLTLVTNDRTQNVDLSTDKQITGAIYLADNQRLEFDSAVLYSGCTPG
jgi:hypothetical protein